MQMQFPINRSSTTTAKDQPSPTQWVEIIEPKSKEKMYANLQTGSCVWDAPEVSHCESPKISLRTERPRPEAHSQRNEIISSAAKLINLRGGFALVSLLCLPAFCLKQLTRKIIVNIAPQKMKDRRKRK